MSTSLTKEAFLQRFNERQDIFKLAIIHDMESINDTVRKLVEVERHKESVNIDISALMGNLVGNALKRLVDLVYSELD